MAKPIRPDPILKGKAAREFERKFIVNPQPDPERAQREKAAQEVYGSTKVIR